MNREARRSHFYLEEQSSPLPTTIAESIEQIKTFALQEFDREIAQKQLYYHNREHIEHVRRRAKQIFQVVRACWESADEDRSAPDLNRMELLLDLCAVAHDMIQVFRINSIAHTTRQREAGVSETATLDRLLEYIDGLNQQVRDRDPDSSAVLTDADIAAIRDAIAATVCAYDPQEQAIYQPALYDPKLSLVARILGLADLGALGIDGIKIYNKEGSLLFLEENPDVVELLLQGNIDNLGADTELYQNVQKRLLKRCRFQVNFAKSRVARFDREVIGFPENAIAMLATEVFKYLNSATLQEIEAITPTADDTPLPVLLQFFEFEQILAQNDRDRPIF